MLGMGMASAHAPIMFQEAQYCPRMVERIPPEAREHLPHSARVELATPAIIDGYITMPAGSTSPSTTGSSTASRGTTSRLCGTSSPSTLTTCARARARCGPGSAWRRR
jgi:hypothetical protein